MGPDAADYDDDGRVDLVVTNLDSETHSLFRGLDDRLFAYATTESGLGFVTLPFVGFGAVFLTTTMTPASTSQSRTAISWTTLPNSAPTQNRATL